MQIGGEHFFDEPFIKYFKKFLELNTKVQLIIENATNIDVIQKIKETYADRLEIRYFVEDISGTMRNFVFGKEIAINGIKNNF